MDKRYFKEANRWFIDNYRSANEKIKLYRIAVIACITVCILLSASIFVMLPLKTYVPLPILVDNENRVVKPIQPGTSSLPISQPMAEFDVMNYVLSRESYNPFQIEHQITKIVHTSSSEVLKSYEKLLNSDMSPIKIYGKEGRIETEINNIVILNSPQNHRPFEELASDLIQVDFTKHTFLNGQKADEKYTALVTFDYRGVPEDELEAWHNWNGFIVTSYQLRRRV